MPRVRRDRKAAWDGPIVSTLVDLTSAAKVHPYRKWWGVHWRLVSLADFAPPVDRADVRARLDAGIDRELTWITHPRHKLPSGVLDSARPASNQTPSAASI